MCAGPLGPELKNAEEAVQRHVSPPTSVAVIILWYDDRELVLVKKPEHAYWELPGTRIAEGERLHQAASRVAWFEVGLAIDTSRFSSPIRSLLATGGVELTSVSAELTHEEYDSLCHISPSGTHRIMTVPKPEIRHYLPRKRDQRLMVRPGA